MQETGSQVPHSASAPITLPPHSPPTEPHPRSAETLEIQAEDKEWLIKEGKEGEELTKK